jgi:putative peptidoglycan lipid II flippase
MTLISRVLGLIRDVVVASIMGAGAGADVFILANKIPNFLRRLFAEGAFAQAFIPVLTEVKQNGTEQDLKHFIAKVAGTLGVIVTLVTIVGVIASPVVIALFGTGWFIDYLNGSPGGDKYELASSMLKITFPYLMFISLTGLSGAVLNTLNKFAVSAFTPVLLNVGMISCAILLSPQFEQPAYALAWGVFFGGLLQLLFQLPFLYRAGVLVKPQWGWHDPSVVKVRTLMIPALFGVSVGQLNLLFDTFIASFLGTGPISWLYFSDRLLEFPLGLFGIAIATVILPTLSRNHSNDDAQAFAKNMDWGIRMVCILGIPAAAGLILLAEPLLLVIFYRGEFTLDDAAKASFSLMAYGTGLLSFMLVKVLAPGFFSRQDTKTPVKIGIGCMVANMGFNVIFVIPYGYVGLAIATSLSAALNAIWLYVLLNKQGVYQLSRETLMLILKVFVASLCMTVVVLYLSPAIEYWQVASLIQNIMQLAILIGSAALTFIVSLFLLGMRLSDIKGHRG